MTADEFINGFQKLRLSAPRISLMGYQNQNCPYINNVYNSKNCYLTFDSDGCENCLYSGLTTRCKFCVDCEDTWDSELCYEGVEIYNSYNCDFSQFLRDCSDCSYSFDCLNCHNCFGCVGLRRKNYHIFNKPVPQEEYSARIAQLKKLSLDDELGLGLVGPKPSEKKEGGRVPDVCLGELVGETLVSPRIKSQVESIREKYPHLGYRMYRTENCFGDNIQNSTNCFYCFNVKGIYDGAYLYDIYNVYGERTEDAYDCYFNVDLHHCYENIQVGDGWNCNFSHCCEHVRDIEFSELCFNSQYLFGCISINRRKYLILNQQYQKEAWHKKVAALREGLKKSGKYGWKVFSS